MALSASHCTVSRQGQGLDTAGQEDWGAQSQKSQVMFMVLQGSLVVRVGHRKAAAPDLFRPVQLAETVFSQAHPVPAGVTAVQRVRVSCPRAPRPSCLSLQFCTSCLCPRSLVHLLSLSPSLSGSLSIAFVLLPKPLHLCHVVVLLAGEAHRGRDIWQSCSLHCSHHFRRLPGLSTLLTECRLCCLCLCLSVPTSLHFFVFETSL